MWGIHRWPAGGEFPAESPVTRSFDAFFDLRLNKRLSKQSYGWWFETPSCPLWRHCNDIMSALLYEIYSRRRQMSQKWLLHVVSVTNSFLIWNDCVPFLWKTLHWLIYCKCMRPISQWWLIQAVVIWGDEHIFPVVIFHRWFYFHLFGYKTMNSPQNWLKWLIIKANTAAFSHTTQWSVLCWSGVSCKPRSSIRNERWSLQCRHNGCDGVSNYQRLDCLFNRLFSRRSKKTSKLRVTGLCARNSPVTSEFPA